MLDKTACETSYRGGDGQCVFPIPFPFLEAGHIEAEFRSAGASRLLAAGADYVVNTISDANGELVLLGEPLPEEATLAIRRRVPLTQEIFFHNQGPNSPRATEEALDKLTMIAQQLRAEVGACSETANEALGGEGVSRLRSDIDDLAASLAKKAEREHGHEMAAVSGLTDRLSAKADAQDVTAALAKKASLTDMAGKANVAHKHAQADVTGLGEALGRKVDTDDPRFAASGSHAARHAAGGNDPVSPESLGVLPAPPADGKAYLAANGGWIEHIASSGEGSGGGGTLDHFQLVNRDAADQHPQKSIQNLPKDLSEIRTALASLETASVAAASGLAGKADKSELPGPASQGEAGLMSAADKRKLDVLSAAGDGLPMGGGAGDILARDGSGTPGWQTPAQVADSLPFMSTMRSGVAKLAPDGGLTIDASGRLAVAVPTRQSLTFSTNGTAIDYALSHSLNTRDVLVQVHNAATGGRVDFGVAVPDAGRVVLSAKPARPAGETYRVAITAHSGT